MPDDTITIKVEGLDEAIKNVGMIGGDLPHYLSGAGQEVSHSLLSTRGLQNYPPATQANFPPPPFYIRGRGRQTSASRNDGKSERLGTKWQTRRQGEFGLEIRNPASYAPFVHGEHQARWMAAIGWRILYEVAREKTDTMAKIYSRWIDKLLRKHGLE